MAKLENPEVSPRLAKNLRRNILERCIEFGLLCSGIFAIFITLAIIYVLVSEAIPFFQHVSLYDFLTDTVWTPNYSIKHYGIMALVSGTLTTTFIALLVAVPLGTITAIYLSEFATHKVRETIKPVLELLVGVPTVVFGYFALMLVTPLLQKIYPDLTTFNMLGPGIVMGIMIVPYIASVAEDAMRAVPMAMREGAYAMGATRFQTAIKVITPAAISGIIAAYILAISRAVGETMIVAIAAGQQPNFTFNPVESAATITAYIVSVALGDLEHGGIGYQSIFAAGLTLLLMTLMFNIIGHAVRKKFAERY
ncbi:MAG: phosphate ABC transporter permease subunit PstC [Nitrosomonadales bacterium]|jgi:phosphate transport system permease protein|nr:phosphate ABC transporter permease subunit PstC [Nitrosomonadales bacterium]MBT3917876.1 phosphate ABC transporter permease subunit PstC [Nitrosomonadales bacterium]MBT4571238.1 phosphate ABC transporter permease subunit PstC [Nitrosomonadales bacterium]MBT4759036.1 phosphate ABC transporter permease subunit PstC [Nitrosomonadales bacterium]MBT5150460.1 phosphate ABC transporter permease subunit PstC [Nitrosomonadales bacterium]